MGEQRVLVREEHFGPGVVGARQIAQHQVEPGGPLRHVGQHAVQPGQLPVHLRGVAGPHGLRRAPRRSARMSGNTRRDSCASSRLAAEHLLDRPEGPVPGLGELVDVVPVAVLGEVRGAGAVVGAVQHLPFGEGVEQHLHVADGAPPPACSAARLAEYRPGVGRVHQHLVVGPGPVEGAQQPQVLVAFLGGREVEQPQPVIESERVDAERASAGAPSSGLAALSGPVIFTTQTIPSACDILRRLPARGTRRLVKPRSGSG